MGSSGDSDITDFSTFFTECKELAYLMENSDQRALVLVSDRARNELSRCSTSRSELIHCGCLFCLIRLQVDELGRATSSSDGVGICWATAEALSARPACYTVFATHFLELCRLPALYPNIRNLHLRVSIHDAPGTGRQLRFLFKVAAGEIEAETVDLQYGIEIARMAAFPADIIDEAREIGKKLREQVSMQRVNGSSASDSDHGPNSSHPRTRVPTTLLGGHRPAPVAALPHLRNTFVQSCHTFADKGGNATVWPSLSAAFQKLRAQHEPAAAAAPSSTSHSSVEPITNSSHQPSDVDEIKIDDDGVMHPPGAQVISDIDAAAPAADSIGSHAMAEEIDDRSIVNASITAMQEME